MTRVCLKWDGSTLSCGLSSFERTSPLALRCVRECYSCEAGQDAIPVSFLGACTLALGEPSKKFACVAFLDLADALGWVRHDLSGCLQPPLLPASVFFFQSTTLSAHEARLTHRFCSCCRNVAFWCFKNVFEF